MNNINNRWFQWIIGERKGQIQIFDSIESGGADVYIKFKDGSRINENLVSPLNQTDLTGMYMAEIDDPNNCWVFKEEWVGRTEEVWVEQDETNPGNKVCVDPGNPGKKVIKLIPPRPTPKTHSSFGPITQHIVQQPMPEPIVNIETQKSKINNSDPIYILLSKSKKEEIDITMSMTVSLPSKHLYNIAKESFEDGNEKFIEYIIEHITVDEIKDALKISLTNMYEDINDISSES